MKKTIFFLVILAALLAACGGSEYVEAGGAPTQQYGTQPELCGYTTLLADDDEGSMHGNDLYDYEAVLFHLEGCGYADVICFGMDDVEGTAGHCFPVSELSLEQ